VVNLSYIKYRLYPDIQIVFCGYNKHEKSVENTLNGRALAIDALVSITTATTVNVPVFRPATIALLNMGAFGLIRGKR